VYREALQLKSRHPEALLVALEEGEPSVVHHEAALLLDRTIVAPKPSPPAYLLIYLKHWVRRAGAMRHLIETFAPQTASFGPGARRNDRLAFLRVEYLHHTNYLTEGLVLADLLAERRVGYVHVYGSTFPAVRALVAHHLLGVQFSLSTFVDFDYPTPFHMLEDKLRAARFVVVCTDYCRRQLAARFPALTSRLFVLRHALLRDYAAGKALRPADGRTRLVYVGRFVPKKGLDVLIAAAAELRRRGVNVTCHLYGQGESLPALSALVHSLHLSDVVFLAPPVPNHDLYRVMNRDDIFVCPSRIMPDGERDGIPVTLLEAMAAGITVVSTPVSGIPELVDDGRNGYLVPAGDSRALADLLQVLVREPERRAAIADAARATVRERFDLEQAGDRLHDRISRERLSSVAAS
jgi:glycosyltransferase involved in cell wall biosynthesis